MKHLKFELQLPFQELLAQMLSSRLQWLGNRVVAAHVRLHVACQHFCYGNCSI